MAKVLFAAGLVSFFAALVSEIGFIMLRLTTASGTTTASPGSVYGLIVWGCIGVGVFCWIIAAAIVVAGHFWDGS
ncbi:MAG: hypothetical protein JW753_00670 [Dehalococcoidia bacterium]|nr:hypothetical protein [Dehalococcoidia bacterium]